MSGDVHSVPDVRGPCAILLGITGEGAHTEDVAGQRDVAVIALYAEVKDVGQRVLLCVEAIGRDVVDEVHDVRTDRLESDRGQCFPDQAADLMANTNAFAVAGRAYATHLVRHVANAVVPEAEHAEW